MKFQFKSIDTWLEGICRSHCKLHNWNLSSVKGAKSLFNVEDEKEIEESDLDDGSQKS
jgi:hypothetical protein